MQIVYFSIPNLNHYNMLFNIVIGLIVVGITVIIQALGSMFWVRKYGRDIRTIKDLTSVKYGTRLLISTSVFLIFIHLVQALLWAITYLFLPGIDEIETLEKAVYFSLVTFTTLGYGEITIGSSHRILAGLEAINGITLIGWSTAFMFTIFQNMLKQRFYESVKKND